MGKMKEIYIMLKGGASNDTVAYWIFNNTKVGDWWQAKEIAREMRNEYEQQNNEDREEIDETE
jgi:hypothetical protein